MKVLSRLRQPLAREPFAALRDGLVESSLIGVSTLNGPFEASRGFGVTFTGDGRAEVLSRFPQLGPWFACALGRPAIEALTPWWRRTPDELPNAWYLNVLVMGPGAQVARHIDGTLMRPAGVTEQPPRCVTVLYLVVPEGDGGELTLWNGSLPVGQVRPRAGDALHFRGDLAHAVSPFTGDPSSRRVSLVIEQYHFAPEPLARLPAFHLESRAGFENHLRAHASRPPRPFELEP